MQRPAEEHSRERVYTDDELKKLWDAWEQMAYPFGALFEVLLVTAQRRGEVAAMRAENVSTKERLWTLPTTKAGHSHEVPLSLLATEIVSRIPGNGGGLVFTTTNEGMVSGFSKAVRRAREISGVADFRPHDLRRTAGTGMARLGIPKITISRVLNHAEGGVTDIYVRHSYLAEKRSALNQWAMKLRDVLAAPAPSKEEHHET
jgi:integrase